MSNKSRKTGYSESVLNRLESNNSSIWPEWSDTELNAEQWDYPRGGRFCDSEKFELPRSLRPFEWKKFNELNGINAPIVYEAIPGYPDLITNNSHLMHSEFIRHFISALTNLWYCGRNGLEIENPASNFSWNLGDQRWHGWYNVYSLNKAGKGVSHRPVFNPNGKYVVRIFHMGRWRRILVDDSIPIDEEGRSLLPRTSNLNEIWPMVLSKAMLKIAALSWTSDREIMDCSLVTCLTGWISLSLDLSHFGPCEQWALIVKYSKHFDWPEKEKAQEDQTRSNTAETTKKSRKSKDKETRVQVPENPQPTYLFLSFEDMRNVDDEAIPGITPCWSHQMYVELSRDVPLDPRQVKAPLAKWKNHRWLDWAIHRGIDHASQYFVPLRCLLVVSPLGNYTRNVLCNVVEIDDSDETVKLKNKKIPKTSNETERKNVESAKQEISLWADFNKISSYLREFNLFYRQQFFEYSIEISDTLNNSVTNDSKKNKADHSAREAKKSATKFSGPSLTLEKTYEYHDKLWRSRNEPLYLFVDSLDDKFFLIHFSTINREKIDGSASKKSSSVIIERHNWFDGAMEKKLIGSLNTRGTKSMVFELEAGRHLLRIFINFESSYRIIILSDTPFEIGDRLKMHHLMIPEARRVEKFSREISNCLIKALKSFGTSDYSSNLRNYYKSYMPDRTLASNRTDRRILKSIHDWAMEESLKLVEKRFSPMELSLVRRAMRIFFIDPSIGRQKTSVSDSYEDEENWENNESEWEPNGPVTIIQSFFRMAMVKRYKKIHDPSDAEHYRVKNVLSQIMEAFDYEKHENLANFLLRNIVKRNQRLEKLYPWTGDLQHVIQIQEIGGRVSNVAKGQWIPIVRVRANVEEPEIVFAAIDLFANLTNYTVRAFENDTFGEILRIVNNVTPNYYRYRENGYTIFAYGWNESETYKEIDWSLHLTTMKGEPIFHWINETKVSTGKINVEAPFLREISNVYVPNSRNCVFKLIAKVRRRTLMSLRMRTSYERVLTKLLVLKENGSTVAEIEARGIVTLPLVFLDFDSTSGSEMDSRENLIELKKSGSRKSSGSLSYRLGNFSRRDLKEAQSFHEFTKYTIEAYVRQNSWPLTEAEWRVVAEFKSRGFHDCEINPTSSKTGKKSESSRKLSRKSLEIGELAEPFWRLQIITDSEDELEIIRDTTKKDKISEFIKISGINESERSERGRKLQENFIEENSLIVARSAIEIVNGSTRKDLEQEIESNDSPEFEISKKPERTLEPPENFASYLPKLDLTVFMVKEEEEEERWVKSDFDEETLRNQRAINVLDFEQLQSLNLEESSRLLEKKREKYQRITQKYLENRDKRARDINEAYEVRQAYLDSTKDTTRSIKSKDSVKTKRAR